jgi:hypothetical protein
MLHQLQELRRKKATKWSLSRGNERDCVGYLSQFLLKKGAPD